MLSPHREGGPICLSWLAIPARASPRPSSLHNDDNAADRINVPQSTTPVGGHILKPKNKPKNSGWKAAKGRHMAKKKASRAVSGRPAKAVNGGGPAAGDQAPVFKLPRGGGGTVRLE